MKNNEDIYILGISCFYHDSAAALLKNGEIIAAAQEERFTRKKHDDDFPENAIKYCLSFAGITKEDLNSIAYYEKPLTKFERLLKTYIRTWPRSYVSFLKAMSTWLGKKLWIPSIIRKEFPNKDIYYIEHHLSHAASSFFSSPYDNAAILTLDGVGEFATATYGTGEGNNIKILKEIHFPHSLGLLYSAFTYYLGFKVNSAEYKVMGLAPYGEPKYMDEVYKLIDVKEDGSFKLNMKYFSYEHGLKMTNRSFDKLFGAPAKKPETKLTQRDFDIARSLQQVLEEIILKITTHIKKETGKENLCMAGGVALNCVANGRILRDSPFKNVFIQPAAGDAGSAVGAALYTYRKILKKDKKYSMKDVYLGPEFTEQEIRELLSKYSIKHKNLDDEALFDEISDHIINQCVVGWFQGRMEYGPRALGNRSIIADARNKENWQRVNLKIKFRESFRPFAPTVIKEDLQKYFDIDVETPYMLLTAQVKEKTIPAITHVDNSARIQSVSQEENKRYHSLISRFRDKTNTGVVINTSFNVRGEPIVCTPEDALKCFLRTDMDVLVLQNYVINKKDIKLDEIKKNLDFEQKFEKD